MYWEKWRKCPYPYSLIHHYIISNSFFPHSMTLYSREYNLLRGPKEEKKARGANHSAEGGHTDSREMSAEPKPSGSLESSGSLLFWASVSCLDSSWWRGYLEQSSLQIQAGTVFETISLGFGDGSVGIELVPQTWAHGFEFPHFHESQIW